MSILHQYIWVIPLLPLIAAIVNVLLSPVLQQRIAAAPSDQARIQIERIPGLISVVLVGLAFLAAILVFTEVLTTTHDPHAVIQGVNYQVYTWIGSGDFQVDIGFYVDQLTAAMMLLVTGVGWLIHIYSMGYMENDRDPINGRDNVARFFSYLSLFVFAMLMLIMGNNYLLMFLGWEGVGVCSYLLIGFWYNGNPHNHPITPALAQEPPNAAKKAFITNRIGDVGFALGIMLLFTNFGSLAFVDIFPQAGKPFVLGNITIACLLLFTGAIGKSAQFPLHVWLPDAMEGPTPVSALIHAATMVTAGVYLVARSNPLFHQSPDALFVVMIIGLVTALLGATIAVTNNRLKRVVAYSTMSQLGYMFVGLGVGAYTAAIFHLLMHGVFKALLFLGSGSVMHGLHNEEDIRKMGQLHKTMPWTTITFVLGALSNAGFWLFSGFFSKDEIISAGVLSKYPWVGALLIFASFLTAFYMFRLVFKVFWGSNHVDPHIHPHESPWLMLGPLVILAVPSVILGALVGLPPDTGLIHDYLNPVFATAIAAAETPAGIGLLIIGGLAATIGIFFAFMIYFRESGLDESLREFPLIKPFYNALLNRWYFDDLYELVFVRGGRWFTELAWTFDRNVVDGLVNGVAGFMRGSGARLRHTQTGFVGNYAFAIALGLFGLVSYLFYITVTR